MFLSWSPWRAWGCDVLDVPGSTPVWPLELATIRGPGAPASPGWKRRTMEQASGELPLAGDNGGPGKPGAAEL